MYIISPNLRHTTREHHKRFRTFTVNHLGATRFVEKKLPKSDYASLWI